MNTEANSGYWVVTGGAGFIGSHTVEALLESGRRVVVLDDFSTGHRRNLAAVADHERLRIIEAKIEHGLFSPLAGIERDWGQAQVIVHLAAQTSVVSSVSNPLQDIRVNYTGTAQVLEFARATAVETVLFASSAAVYGDVEKLPVREDYARWPMSPYGVNKLGSEQLMCCYSKIYGLHTVAGRFFNVYGPRQDPASPYSGVISIFIDRALRSLPLTIFGDGLQTRDFVYVTDIANSLIHAASQPKLSGHVSVNVGTGRETTIKELAQLISKLCESDANIVHVEDRAGEIRASVADLQILEERWGISAKVELAKGLQETVNWYRADQEQQNQRR